VAVRHSSVRERDHGPGSERLSGMQQSGGLAMRLLLYTGDITKCGSSAPFSRRRLESGVADAAPPIFRCPSRCRAGHVVLVDTPGILRQTLGCGFVVPWAPLRASFRLRIRFSRHERDHWADLSSTRNQHEHSGGAWLRGRRQLAGLQFLSRTRGDWIIAAGAGVKEQDAY
jgi:hypothetical protein